MLAYDFGYFFLLFSNSKQILMNFWYKRVTINKLTEKAFGKLLKKFGIDFRLTFGYQKWKISYSLNAFLYVLSENSKIFPKFGLDRKKFNQCSKDFKKGRITPLSGLALYISMNEVSNRILEETYRFRIILQVSLVWLIIDSVNQKL